MEIPKIMSKERRTKNVPFMNSSCIPSSTNRCCFVANHHINTSNELAIITTIQ
jgi:hypothetical protein